MRSAIRSALDGLTVAETADEHTTAAVAAACRPDLIVLDATDKGAATRTVWVLRNDFRTALISILYLVDEIPDGSLVGGCDDYVVHPFSSDELAARVRLSLERSSARRGISPLTGLPGNMSVFDEIAARQATGVPFACLYIDLDAFKSFNDRHGFVRGDEAILAVARSVVRVATECSPAECFVGHLGGDDFVVIAPTSIAVEAAARICEDFDARDCGCSISIGVVDRAETFADPAAVAEAAAGAKAAAKSRPGSGWAVSRRASRPA